MGISSIVGYLMPNPLYTYILDIYDLVWFYSISTLVGYLMPNPVPTYILNILFENAYFVDNIFKWARAHLFAHS